MSINLRDYISEDDMELLQINVDSFIKKIYQQTFPRQSAPKVLIMRDNSFVQSPTNISKQLGSKGDVEKIDYKIKAVTNAFSLAS